MSYARLILSAATKEALPTGLTKALPARYAATPLIQHYLTNIFALLPVCEEAALYASVDAIYQKGDVATPWDKWTVRMVLAIACLSQSEQRGDTHYSDAVGHVNAALENAEDVLHPGYVTSIQALVLFTIYATMDPHHFDSWTLIGAASRAMVDLGMHQDPSRNVAVAKGKLEVRRRVYWCVYALDRYVKRTLIGRLANYSHRSTSLVQTRAFSFSDEATHVSFPFHNAATSPRYSSPQAVVFLQNFDTALDLFRIREIQSEWYMDLFQSGREPWQDAYPYIWKQYARMSEWFQDMPQSILPASKSAFELELLYSYVYILSPSPRIPHIDEYAQRLIFEHCISYSINLLALLNKPLATSRPPVTFYDAMRAYMTGRQFVDVLSRNLDVILNPIPPSPPETTTPPMASDDPLAPPAQVGPPPFPTPLLPEGQITPLDPTMRAINALNDFTQILSNFGLRFGFTHWRDRFQRESAALSAQLYQHKSTSPHTSPPPHQLPATTFPPQWVPMPSVSPHVRGVMYPGPTTPPSLFPQQSSPFSGSTSYNGNPFDAMAHSPYQQTLSYDGSSQQHAHMYTTPSPQPIPEMPQPTDGKRRAMVYGPGIPRQQSQENGVAQDPTHVHAREHWPHPGPIQHQPPSQVDNTWVQGAAHDGGTVQWNQGGQGNWG